MVTKHTYLKTHTLSAAALVFVLPQEDAALRERAAQAPSGRAARTLVKEGGLRVTLIAMRKGSALRAHQVEGELTIHVLRGRARVSAQGTTTELGVGGLIVLQEEVTHTAEAAVDCSLLVTVAMTSSRAGS